MEQIFIPNGEKFEMSTKEGGILISLPKYLIPIKKGEKLTFQFVGNDEFHPSYVSDLIDDHGVKNEVKQISDNKFEVFFENKADAEKIYRELQHTKYYNNTLFIS